MPSDRYDFILFFRRRLNVLWYLWYIGIHEHTTIIDRLLPQYNGFILKLLQSYAHREFKSDLYYNIRFDRIITVCNLYNIIILYFYFLFFYSTIRLYIILLYTYITVNTLNNQIIHAVAGLNNCAKSNIGVGITSKTVYYTLALLHCGWDL